MTVRIGYRDAGWFVRAVRWGNGLRMVCKDCQNWIQGCGLVCKDCQDGEGMKYGL